MYDHKINQTRQQILDAFLTLVKEKDVSKITINDITTIAKINRSTFYRHFDDKFDLIEKTETTIFNAIEKSLQDNILNGQIKSITQAEFGNYRLELLGILKDNADFISAMLSKNGDLTFESKLIAQMRDFSMIGLSALGIDFDSIPASRELTMQFMANGLIGVVRHWLANDDISIETVAQTMDTIMSNGIIASFGFEAKG
ncbi:TetR/AcrR family transcriptional regulator [Weissella cibaria]|uniref:TetR/AcrR family transcriptional regulator n=1 Tax=Weissella cibaria TaxID=137591 RepID=UPI001131BC15|nr:TetR-like C-terminal domain-containing protein [Weissella cibaria]QDG81083.1 TetR/AcrR family transcriptional regulator [Weissella cibaria]